MADYNNTFRKLQRYLGDDRPIGEIGTEVIRGFLAAHGHLSKKTVLNYHTGLSALWQWAADEGLVARPRPEKRAVERSRPHQRNVQREMTYRLNTAAWNKALLLVLLDTGVRAEELCKAQMEDLDLRNLKLKVMGKGAKERILQISASTGQAVWRYLAMRSKEDKRPRRSLFVSSFGRE